MKLFVLICLQLIALSALAGQVRQEQNKFESKGMNGDATSIYPHGQKSKDHPDIQRQEERNAAKPEAALPAELDEDSLGEFPEGEAR